MKIRNNNGHVSVGWDELFFDLSVVVSMAKLSKVKACKTCYIDSAFSS